MVETGVDSTKGWRRGPLLYDSWCIEYRTSCGSKPPITVHYISWIDHSLSVPFAPIGQSDRIPNETHYHTQ